jgi:hypothetical protein
MAEKPLHVAICVPSTGTHITETMLSITAMGIMGAHRGLNQSILQHQQASVANCRNQIASDAVRIGTDWTLWVDSDMAFSPLMLLRLLSHNKDIVGATYPKRTPPYTINGRPTTDKTEGELQEFDFLPFGAILVRTEVFRKIPEPWFYESYEFKGTKSEQVARALTCALNIELSRDFLDVIEDAVNDSGIEDGEGADRLTAKGGEDYNFCREARRAGYKIWCDLKLSQEMIHLGKQCVSIGASLPGISCEVLGPKAFTG